MTVRELIDKLNGLPQDAPVTTMYDTIGTNSCDVAWLARSGKVVLAEYGELVGFDEERPIDAPDYPAEWNAPERQL